MSPSSTDVAGAETKPQLVNGTYNNWLIFSGISLVLQLAHNLKNVIGLRNISKTFVCHTIVRDLGLPVPSHGSWSAIQTKSTL